MMWVALLCSKCGHSILNSQFFPTSCKLCPLLTCCVGVVSRIVLRAPDRVGGDSCGNAVGIL